MNVEENLALDSLHYLQIVSFVNLFFKHIKQVIIS